MRELKMFEIPIYSKRKEIFDKKWKDYIFSFVQKTADYNKESLEKDLKNLFCYNKIWKYNQIIGYIVINIKNNDIWFDEYATLDKNIRFNGGRKHFISNLQLNGCHFYIKEKMTDNDIKKEINKWLLSIEKNILNKSWYLDKEIFNNTIKYLNIREIIDSEK